MTNLDMNIQIDFVKPEAISLYAKDRLAIRFI